MPVLQMPMPEPRSNEQRQIWIQQLRKSIEIQMRALEAQLKLLDQIENAPPAGGDPATGR